MEAIAVAASLTALIGAGERAIQFSHNYCTLPKRAKKQAKVLKSYLRTMKKWQKDFNKYGSSALPITKKVVKIIAKAENALTKFSRHTSFIKDSMATTVWANFRKCLGDFFKRLKLSYSRSSMEKYVAEMKKYSTQMSRLLDKAHKEHELESMASTKFVPKAENDENSENSNTQNEETPKPSATTVVVVCTAVGCVTGALVGGIAGGIAGAKVGAAAGSVCGFLGGLARVFWG